MRDKRTTKMKVRISFTVRLVLAGLVCLTACGAGMAIYGHTVIDWWLPVAAAVFAALLTMSWLAAKWRIVTGTTGRTANSLFHLCAVGSAAYLLLLAGNYATAADSSAVREKAVVTQKFRKQHKRYRRAGRYRTRPDGTYDTFHLVVSFDGGRKEKELTVTRSEYNRTRRGSTRIFVFRQGGLGFPVMDKAGK